MFKLRICIAIVWLLVANSAFCQHVPFSPSASYVLSATDDLLEKLTQKYEEKKRHLPTAHRKEFEKIYRENYDTLVSRIQNKHFIFDDKLSAYYGKIVNHILHTNPLLSNHDVRLLISRRADPNASSMGYGLITLHVGLSRRFENESQAAFILCHELAHQYLNHIDKGITQYVESMYGKATQRQISKIVNSDNQKVSRTMDLLRQTIYANNRHSRLHESAADSLALLFLQHTSYDEAEALTALALLDNVDKEKYSYELPLKQLFDSPAYAFKDSWLQSSSLLNMEDKEEYWDKDSLKTHPDCQVRINTVAKHIKGVDINKKKFLQPQPLFQEILQRSDIELIERELYFQRYSRCLYESLLLAKQHPQSAYLQATIGQCMYGIYQAQKNHQLSKHVDLPAPGQSKEYRQLLDFIHNLRLKEIAQVGYHFLKNKYTDQSTEEFLVAYAGLSKAIDAVEELAQLKKAYLYKYPQGKYVQQILQL